jgi:structural maintenance of chromosome 4
MKCVNDLAAATERRNKFRVTFENLRKKRLSEFFAGFRTISEKLKEMYQVCVHLVIKIS